MGTTLHTASQTYLLRYNSKHMVCFFDDACYSYYLVRLFNSLQQFHIQLHAYCLVPKEINLLLTPATPEGTHNLWLSVTGQYNSYFRERFARTTRIINPSFQSTPLGEGKQVLRAQMFIEGIPLAIPGIAHPGVHPWSSYCNNGFGDKSPWLKPHRAYLEFLDKNKQASNAYLSYRENVVNPIIARDNQAIIAPVCQA